MVVDQMCKRHAHRPLGHCECVCICVCNFMWSISLALLSTHSWTTLAGRHLPPFGPCFYVYRCRWSKTVSQIWVNRDQLHIPYQIKLKFPCKYSYLGSTYLHTLTKFPLERIPFIHLLNWLYEQVIYLYIDLKREELFVWAKGRGRAWSRN